MTTHANFLTNSENAFRCLRRRSRGGPHDRDAGLGAAVPRHRLQQPADPVLELGGRVEILSSPLDFDGFFEAVGAHGVNQLVSVPAIYHAVIRHPRFAELDVSGVRWVSYGGAPIAESLVRQIMDAFPNARVGNGFGLTETSSLTSFLPARGGRRSTPTRSASRCRWWTSRSTSADPQSGVGELLVRGPNVVRGYWNKPRGDRRDVRRTAGCTPAISRASTPTACSTSSIARRT